MCWLGCPHCYEEKLRIMREGKIMELPDDFYAPVGKPDFIELPMPDGVHLISQESMDIMKRIAERGTG